MDVALNWIAQGGVVALAAAAGLRVIPVSRAPARYGLVWTAYLLVLALPAVPFLVGAVVGWPTDDVGPAAAGPVVAMPAAWWTSPAVPIGLWLVWAGVQTRRLAVAAVAVHDARRRARPCPAGVLARLSHWSAVSAHGRQARVVLSSQVRAAAVLGGASGTPAIALAPAIIAQLGPADLDRVLVHEWAHVQRRDDLAELGQRVLHILIGWHPAVWWLDRQLALEREAACDELVVRVTGSAKGYAACLTTLAALPGGPLRPVSALAAAARSRLGERVVRILAARGAAAGRPRRAATLCVGGGLLACTVGVGSVSFVAPVVTPAFPSVATYPLRAKPLATDMLAAVQPAERVDPGAEPVAAGRRGSRRGSAVAADEAPPGAGEPAPIELPPGSTAASTRLETSAWPVEPLRAVAAAMDFSALPAHAAAETPSPALPGAAGARPAEQARGVWTRAADVGAGVGRVSQRAGAAAAGFFGRFGMKVAGSF